MCVCFHMYVCHCEVAPVCAVIAADGRREASNFSPGERRERGRKVLMSRIVVVKLKSPSKKQAPSGSG